jgi:hypothetical protein
MKLFIGIMLCVVVYLSCDIAHADLVTDNTDGGRIYLEEFACPMDSSMRFAISTAPNSTILRGCWVEHDGMYWVFWESGINKTYPMYVFKERQHEDITQPDKQVVPQGKYKRL